MFKFQHLKLYTKNPHKSGRLTVVSFLDYGDTDYPVQLKFAVSFCSPKDMFVKRIGREKAMERYLSNDSKYYFSIPLEARRYSYSELTAIIINTIFESENIPDWVYC